eukprot:371513_1
MDDNNEDFGVRCNVYADKMTTNVRITIEAVWRKMGSDFTTETRDKGFRVFLDAISGKAEASTFLRGLSIGAGFVDDYVEDIDSCAPIHCINFAGVSPELLFKEFPRLFARFALFQFKNGSNMRSVLANLKMDAQSGSLDYLSFVSPPGLLPWTVPSEADLEALKKLFPEVKAAKLNTAPAQVAPQHSAAQDGERRRGLKKPRSGPAEGSQAKRQKREVGSRSTSPERHAPGIPSKSGKREVTDCGRSGAVPGKDPGGDCITASVHGNTVTVSGRDLTFHGNESPVSGRDLTAKSRGERRDRSVVVWTDVNEVTKSEEVKHPLERPSAVREPNNSQTKSTKQTVGRLEGELDEMLVQKDAPPPEVLDAKIEEVEAERAKVTSRARALQEFSSNIAL